MSNLTSWNGTFTEEDIPNLVELINSLYSNRRCTHIDWTDNPDKELHQRRTSQQLARVSASVSPDKKSLFIQLNTESAIIGIIDVRPLSTWGIHFEATAKPQPVYLTITRNEFRKTTPAFVPRTRLHPEKPRPYQEGCLLQFSV